jgi:hypothetical protein
MAFFGEILSEPDPPGINKQRWLEIIREHPNLAPIPPKKGINPFTRESMLIHAATGSVLVVVDGSEVGSMGWALDGSNKITVSGESDTVLQLARDIAKEQGGRFEECFSSEP